MQPRGMTDIDAHKVPCDHEPVESELNAVALIPARGFPEDDGNFSRSRQTVEPYISVSASGFHVTDVGRYVLGS